MVGLWCVNERLRFYRYDIGQQFDWHYDGAFERDNGERSQLTFMVYLNDGFVGGETALEGAIISPRKGLAPILHPPDSPQGANLLSTAASMCCAPT